MHKSDIAIRVSTLYISEVYALKKWTTIQAFTVLGFFKLFYKMKWNHVYFKSYF